MDDTAPNLESRAAALAYVAGLSSPSKMPGRAYGLPAARCITGARLQQVAGSVCESCYALRGFYRMPVVQAAESQRLAAITRPHWVAAMIRAVQPERWFRWHDSGDLQSLEHLERIAAVARGTPRTSHWLPTHEPNIVRAYVAKHGPFPANLVVRISAPMVGKAPVLFPGVLGSSVGGPGFPCPARTQGNKCGDCRACWDPTVRVVSYTKH